MTVEEQQRLAHTPGGAPEPFTFRPMRMHGGWTDMQPPLVEEEGFTIWRDWEDVSEPPVQTSTTLDTLLDQAVQRFRAATMQQHRRTLVGHRLEMKMYGRDYGPGGEGEMEHTATKGEDQGPSLTAGGLMDMVQHFRAMRLPVRIWVVDAARWVGMLQDLVKTDARRNPLSEIPVLECHKGVAYPSFTPPVGWRSGVWVEFSDDTFEPVMGTVPEDVMEAFLREYPTGVMPWPTDGPQSPGDPHG